MPAPSCSVSIPLAWSISARRKCQVRGLATGAGQCREVASRLVLGAGQQQGGGIGEDQRIT